MNKSTITSVVIIVLLVVVAVAWYGTKGPSSITKGDRDSNASSTESIPVSETVKVSRTLSAYQNDELGFSVEYPNVWQREEGNAGVNFVIPLDKSQVSTVATLLANVQVFSGTCAFPPVTTGVKERSTLKVEDRTFNMISLSSVVQGRTYNNRMYSLQKGKICYMFSFSAISQSLASQNLTGSRATQAENNNNVIVAETDKAFTEMVKSFKFVTGPAGKDETQVKP